MDSTHNLLGRINRSRHPRWIDLLKRPNSSTLSPFNSLPEGHKHRWCSWLLMDSRNILGFRESYGANLWLEMIYYECKRKNKLDLVLIVWLRRKKAIN